MGDSDEVRYNDCRMPREIPSEARLAAIVASSDDAIISKDLTGIVTSWNAAAERMFGYTATEAVGRSITLIIPEERLGEEDFVLSRVRAGLGIEHFETVRRRKDGTLIDVSITVSPIRAADGTIIGVSKSARDISALKRMEREAFRLAAIVESSDDAIVSKDLDGIIQTWNPAAQRMFGYTPEEAIGRPITLIIPEDRLSEETTVLSRIRAGQSVEHFETVRRRKDGKLLEISLTVSPIRNASGRVIGASKIARDITESQRLRRTAEEASRAKDEFLAVLSHELRTPLNTVVGYARMLQREDMIVTPEMRTKAVEALARNAGTLIKLVSDVLDTSRIVTGKLRLDHAAFDLGEIVREALDTQRHAVQAKRLHLHTHIEDNIRMIGDSDRLRQVVWNLASNATKFTPPEGRINVDLRRNGSSIRLEVRDTGMGIAQEHLPLIFQRFWQAEAGISREFGGLGLGLALARYLVELHGGSIHAESAGPGKGTSFVVTFPSAAAILAQDRNLRQVKP
jgi:PAS domain S-box-containing protein